MTYPDSPLPVTLEAVRENVRAFLDNIGPDTLPAHSNSPADTLTRYTLAHLQAAFEWMGNTADDPLETPQGQAAAQILIQASYALRVFTELASPNTPATWTCWAAHWADGQCLPLAERLAPSLLERLDSALPVFDEWYTLTQLAEALTPSEAGQLAAWTTVAWLLEQVATHPPQASDVENALTALLDSLEEGGRLKTLN